MTSRMSTAGKAGIQHSSFALVVAVAATGPVMVHAVKWAGITDGGGGQNVQGAAVLPIQVRAILVPGVGGRAVAGGRWHEDGLERRLTESNWGHRAYANVSSATNTRAVG